MEPAQLSDEQLDDLAARLAPRLPSGTHGDKVVLSRRQFQAAAAGVLGVGALTTLGVDEATAQAAGQQGTASSPNDMFAYNLDVQNGADFNGSDIDNVRSFSTEVADITPFASGETTVTGGGSVTLVRDPTLNSDYYQTFTSLKSATGFVSINTKFIRSDNQNTGVILEETNGANDVTVNWAVIKLAEETA